MNRASFASIVPVARGASAPLALSRRTPRALDPPLARARALDDVHARARDASHDPHARTTHTRARCAPRLAVAVVAVVVVVARIATRVDVSRHSSRRRARPTMSAETASLAANARQQIARLLTQLADLEEAREVRANERERARDVSTDHRFIHWRRNSTTTSTKRRAPRRWRSSKSLKHRSRECPRAMSRSGASYRR
jgi:hypothetical protein